MGCASVAALEAAVALPAMDAVNVETPTDVEFLDDVNDIDLNNTNKE